ncbi:hypothetical protein ACROSR_19660 [Roseovarius tibetensis]|uniref:hypothetical protein n=1 Tax=Roseovarius tibetensis TaxID=2685897 RepID=UPI003D7F63E0
MAMTATLTMSERRIGLGLAVARTLLGLAMAGVARHGPMALHGGLAMTLGVALVFVPGGALNDQPEPPTRRLTRYYDAPIRFGIVMTLIWAVIAMV